MEFITTHITDIKNELKFNFPVSASCKLRAVSALIVWKSPLLDRESWMQSQKACTLLGEW